MRGHSVGNGRVYFTVPDLFKASFSLTGAQKPDEGDSEEEQLAKVEQGKEGGTWYLVDLEFFFGIGGSDKGDDIERGAFSDRKLSPCTYSRLIRDLSDLTCPKLVLLPSMFRLSSTPPKPNL